MPCFGKSLCFDKCDGRHASVPRVDGVLCRKASWLAVVMIPGQLIAAILGQSRPSPAEISGGWSGESVYMVVIQKDSKLAFPTPGLLLHLFPAISLVLNGSGPSSRDLL